MGFDLTGLNPNLTRPEPELPPMTERTDKHWEKYHEWQDENCGTYFRNNVWFWRPLWSFVCGACGDILTRKDVEQGSYNDGHKISKTKAKRIASRLRRYLKDGHVDAYESWYARKVSQLKDDDCNRNYPFSIDNVKEFERFCEHSGGFQIY